MGKHTELPWEIGFGEGISGDVASWQPYLDETECHELPIRHGHEAVCVINYGDPAGPAEANAQLIVTAVNNHARLVEALRAMHEIAEFREAGNPHVIGAGDLLAQLDGELE